MQAPDRNSRAYAGTSGARLEELITKARTGSNSALGRALNTCRPRLLRIARKAVGLHLRPRVGASDVVQDTFVNAAKSFGFFRGQRAGEFLGWLCTILSNRVAEIARRTAQATGDLSDDSLAAATDRLARRSDDDERTPESIAANHEYSALIRAALARMTPRDQQVLRLRFDEQLTFPQIGERLELTENAARMLFKRAVKRVKRDLALGSGA